MGAPFIDIDPHGMFQEEAIKVIDKALKNEDNITNQIRLIHRYHRGTSLKDMIVNEYKYDPKVLRIGQGPNLVITVFVLSEL